MQLATYLQNIDVRPTVFAIEIGVSPSTVGRWMRQERFPRPQQIARISELTKGQVTANDFLPQPVEAAATPADIPRPTPNKEAAI